MHKIVLSEKPRYEIAYNTILFKIKHTVLGNEDNSGYLYGIMGVGFFFSLDFSVFFKIS